ncbi:hypothetical protein [uncultured Ruegeria sp.]|uniref:hypothetical protein n=1 Tax=uncultured Ruegeria sp. TaxID=259304 RepID=UPI00260E3342|nr:hypothetical protein [uncultured Ruegeria sp.]
MSLKSRIQKMEGRSLEVGGIKPSAIYLCELQATGAETDDGGEPRLAYIMKGPSSGGQLSRNEDETRDDFKARVELVVEGLE